MRSGSNPASYDHPRVDYHVLEERKGWGGWGGGREREGKEWKEEGRNERRRRGM